MRGALFLCAGSMRFAGGTVCSWIEKSCFFGHVGQKTQHFSLFCGEMLTFLPKYTILYEK